MKPTTTSIVEQVIASPRCDLGQFTQHEKRELERAVRSGVLSKGRGGPYPKIKTVYARPGFDFARDRENGIAEVRRAAMWDIARGHTSFPLPRFEEL